MAFTGTPVVVQVSQRLARITGLSLASGAAGTISLEDNGAGEVQLPAGENWAPYGGDAPGDGVVDLEEAVQVTYLYVADPGAAYGPSDRIAVVKSGGADETTFLITFTSFDTGEAASAEMEIYVRFH